jgi:hypothetical protein
LNFGLFGNISGNNYNVVIKNLSVMNARINITVDDEDKINTPINVGILAGTVSKTQILNTQVYGNARRVTWVFSGLCPETRLGNFLEKVS